MFSIKDIDLVFIKHYLRIEEEFEEDDNELEELIEYLKD